MKTPRPIFLILLTLVITLLGMLYPFQVMQIQYASVLDGKTTIAIKGKDLTENRMFLERDGRIFIKTKTIYSALILTTWIKNVSWEKDDLNLLARYIQNYSD